MRSSSFKRLSLRLRKKQPMQPAAENLTPSTFHSHVPPQQDPLPEIRSRGADAPVAETPKKPLERDRSGLAFLPAEILLCIADHLDDATTICLSAVSHHLFIAMHSYCRIIRQKPRSRCAQWLIMAQLERGLVTDPNDFSKANLKLTCALCKIKLSAASFERYQPSRTTSSSSNSQAPNIMESGFENLRMLSRHPLARFCEHHAMRTVLGRESSDPRRNADQTIRWECCTRRMCLHCGTVPSDGSPPSCGCTCPVCPREALVPTFVRYGPARAAEKVVDDLRVFFLRFERGLVGDGPLLAVERVHRRDDKKWIEAPVTKMAVEYR